jgi:hypothetical protein
MGLLPLYNTVLAATMWSALATIVLLALLLLQPGQPKSSLDQTPLLLLLLQCKLEQQPPLRFPACPALLFHT